MRCRLEESVKSSCPGRVSPLCDVALHEGCKRVWEHKAARERGDWHIEDATRRLARLPHQMASYSVLAPYASAYLLAPPDAAVLYRPASPP